MDMKLENMSKDELSLLLFFETRAVDHGGLVDNRHMNADDFEIAKKWNESGFVKFGRVVYRNITNGCTNWCKLSELAWMIAHQGRKARHERLWLKKDWMSTDDSMDTYGDPHFSGLNSPLRK
jgi:hypothetical protein